MLGKSSAGEYGIGVTNGVVLWRDVNDIARVVESQTESTGGEVCFDLSGLNSIRPGALTALATHVCATAHAGHPVRVTLPTNPACCKHLETISGFCWNLASLRDIRFEGKQCSGNFSYTVDDAILSMTTVDSPAEVEDLAEEVYNGFQRTGGVRSSVLLDEVVEGFWEPAINSVEHSESDVGAFCLAQIWSARGRRIAEFAVADAGVGILATLRRRYPSLSSHKQAIEKSLEEGVSGLDDPQRGIGLSTTHELSRAGSDRRLMIVSGDGCVVASPEETGGRTLAKSWSGTLVSLHFPLSR